MPRLFPLLLTILRAVGEFSSGWNFIIIYLVLSRSLAGARTLVRVKKLYTFSNKTVSKELAEWRFMGHICFSVIDMNLFLLTLIINYCTVISNLVITIPNVGYIYTYTYYLDYLPLTHPRKFLHQSNFFFI